MADGKLVSAEDLDLAAGETGTVGHLSIELDECRYPADNPAYIVGIDHPSLAAAKQALDTALSTAVPVDVWQFATDGGHFSLEGMICVGFGPGNDLLAHTINEAIPISELERGLIGNEALARALDSRMAA